MGDIVASDGTVVFARMAGGVFAIIGGSGLLLAAVGVCGMVSYAARQREPEIGIRAALGAGHRQIMAFDCS